MKISLRRRHALLVEDGGFSHKIYCNIYIFFIEILYLEGHPNCITCSRVAAILLNMWIVPIGGASSEEGQFEFVNKFNLGILKPQE